MAVSDLVNLVGLMDDAKCFTFVRQRRWPEGIRCSTYDNSRRLGSILSLTLAISGHALIQKCGSEAM